MKLGSIVGLIIAGILIISGVITCSIGSAAAKKSGEYLFTQKSESGTYYSETISEETTKLSLNFEDSDIIINGGTETSFIELNNFNPNLYSFSSTRNVITFDEVKDLKSVLNIWENGVTFKGLRYLLDFRTYSSVEEPKSIVINVSDESDLKILSITAERSNVTVKNLNIKGDLLLSVSEGDLVIDGLNASSTLSISGKNIKASVKGASSKTLRYTVDNGMLSVKDSVFTDTQMTAVSGRIDFYTTADLGKYNVTVSSESAGILVNSVPHTGTFSLVNEEPEGTVKIKTTSAGVLIEYPTEENNENENE